MTRYVSRPVEVEAMQWQGPDAEGIANYIVAWVNANGGEARYEEPRSRNRDHFAQAVIAVHTVNGWAYAAPGHYVVKGDAMFYPDARNTPDASRHPMAHSIRDFYPCDPETFERRWTAARWPYLGWLSGWRQPGGKRMSGCEQELCRYWTGDGCACEVLQIPATPEERLLWDIFAEPSGATGNNPEGNGD